MRKRCQSCGDPFEAQRSTAVYCSTRCRTRETRKRAAGRPDAVQAARPATTPVEVRRVTVMLAPGVTVDVEPEVAAKLAAHLPAPGEVVPFATDVRPRFLREREAGIEQLLREQREAAEAAARDAELAAAQAELDARDTEGPTPGSVVERVEHTIRHGGVLSAGELSDAVDAKRAEAQAARDAEHRAAREAAEEQLRENSHYGATLRELESAGATRTALGRNALVLSAQLDEPWRHTGSALASLSREWRATIASALAGAVTEEDPLTAARKAREARIAAAQATANSGAV